MLCNTMRNKYTNHGIIRSNNQIKDAFISFLFLYRYSRETWNTIFIISRGGKEKMKIIPNDEYSIVCKCNFTILQGLLKRNLTARQNLGRTVTAKRILFIEISLREGVYMNKRYIYINKTQVPQTGWKQWLRRDSTSLFYLSSLFVKLRGVSLSSKLKPGEQNIIPSCVRVFVACVCVCCARARVCVCVR